MAWGLIITFALGAFVLIGAAIAGRARNGTAIREASIAVALGALAALLAVDLVPEALEEMPALGVVPSLIGIAAGFAILLALDRFLPESHHAHERHHDHSHDPSCEEHDIVHVSIAATVALVVHNIIEGMSVCGMAVSDATSALLLAAGVGIHNIPLGMIVYAGLRDEGRTRKAGMLAAAALSTFVGGLAMAALGAVIDERAIAFVVCLTIGLLLYLTIVELIPQALRATSKRRVIIGIAVGLALVFASSLLETLA